MGVGVGDTARRRLITSKLSPPRSLCSYVPRQVPRLRLCVSYPAVGRRGGKN